MSDSLENYKFPQTLGQPKRIFGLQMDEGVICIGCVILAFISQSYIAFMLIGVSGVFLLRYLKNGRPSYYLYDSLYWHFPSICSGRNFKKLPSSHLREWVK